MFKKAMLGLAVTACLLVAQAAHSQTNKDSTAATSTTTISEEEKIDRLIAFVKNMKNCKLVRNGSEHIPAEAAEHLQMKRKNHGSKIKTAEDFIKYLATKSSMTGEYYIIRQDDGQEMKLQEVLTRELQRIER
ncbi:DUF5329 family protein [Pontibacter vulgaris]|uniref:DUF5329 family protein n=1 Tax=Pontibacter vulgaris TaxID=2905679 RepID=UPI001FA7F859|nr:DUF5329 family protein [Pontibacter vulgaris]